MTRVYGNTASSYWRAVLEYSVVSNTDTMVRIKARVIMRILKAIPSDDKYTLGNDTVSLTIGGKNFLFKKYGDISVSAGTEIKYEEKTVDFQKAKGAKTIEITGYINHKTGASYYKGKSTAKGSVSVSARTKYTISFASKPSEGVTGIPSAITKYHDWTAYLPSNVPIRDGYKFSSWHFKSGVITGVFYPNSAFAYNVTTQLAAVWSPANAPTCVANTPVLKINNDEQSGGTIIRNFTDVSVDISDIEVYPNRTLDYIRLVLVTKGGEYHSADHTTTEDGTLVIYARENGSPIFTSADEGEASLYIESQDIIDGEAGAFARVLIGKYDVTPPTWTMTFEVPDSTALSPSTNPSGELILDSLKVGTAYDSDTHTFTSYVSTTTTGITAVQVDDGWGFTFVFTEDYVSDPLLTNPDVSLKLEYKHYNIILSEQRGAFYSTTRQLNYSTGIYNQEFISGVDTVRYSGLASRAWWCEYNNPLYFPDTNYLEAGSNDTAIMGLTKVGDYLGLVKQSKTTDTAIYLAYPTSFESDTTYAVKQGVQGVGAIAKYSFNILGDESLFLSPNGVVAIVPSEDTEHKIQNRSYFIDGRLLKESEISSAYSFVFDGMYFLAIGNGNVYVLDGNQRNSWGNDKTNLVYECYFLDNIPATCMVKMNDTLVFSNDFNVYAFTDSYIDAYDIKENEQEPTPVTAEWSTVFDDDSALHYYKTMQKKGNLISILPIENEYPYKEVYVDEATFNAEKTLYFTYDGEKYTQCTTESTYDANMTYYIENRSKTRVYVKKDDKDPVLIQRSFNLQSDIPSEMFFKKKFKKYKRLQFIIVNDSEEDFGIDCIVKNYSIGNYAKR